MMGKDGSDCATSHSKTRRLPEIVCRFSISCLPFSRVDKRSRHSLFAASAEAVLQLVMRSQSESWKELDA